MKKRTYKKIMNRLYRKEMQARIYESMYHDESIKREGTEELLKKYRQRLNTIGNVAKTEQAIGDKLRLISWEIQPERWGQYIYFDKEKGYYDAESLEGHLKEELIRSIAKGLIENDIVQFVVYSYENVERYGTFGAKLYVVPWEQMPISNKMEVRKFVDWWDEND